MLRRRNAANTARPLSLGERAVLPSSEHNRHTPNEPKAHRVAAFSARVPSTPHEPRNRFRLLR